MSSKATDDGDDDEPTVSGEKSVKKRKSGTDGKIVTYMEKPMSKDELKAHHIRFLR